ncbi:hypothetical protein Tco_1232892 [Tanacetum coccineum]
MLTIRTNCGFKRKGKVNILMLCLECQRLFTDGDGGNGSDKPPAPVHPFHPPKRDNKKRGTISKCADKMQQFFRLRRKKKEKRMETEPPTQPPSASLPVTHHRRSKFFSKMHDAFSIMFCL